MTIGAEQRNLDGKLGFISSLHGSISHTDYKHDELAGSALEAIFKNKGWEGHFGGTLVPVNTAFGQLKGAWGIQASSSQLRMTGDSPLVPNADTNTKAFYVFEELSFSKDAAINLGARIEDVRIRGIAGNDSDGDATVGEKKFKPFSTSLGYRQGLNSFWTATSNLSYTERAPTYYELFANGHHHATGLHEIGNPNQKLEKGTTLDLALSHKTEESKIRLGAFVTEFSNFIGLMPQSVDEYRFEGIKARLYGLEADGRFPLLKGAFGKTGQIDLSWKADYVRGENRTTGGSLPRIAPLRVDTSFIYTEGRYSSQLDVRYAARQNRYDDSLGATPGYTTIGVGASYKTVLQGFKSAYWFVRLDNLTNEVARNASSVMRDVAMVGSRSLRAGLRASF